MAALGTTAKNAGSGGKAKFLLSSELTDIIWEVDTAEGSIVCPSGYYLELHLALLIRAVTIKFLFSHYALLDLVWQHSC